MFLGYRLKPLCLESKFAKWDLFSSDLNDYVNSYKGQVVGLCVSLTFVFIIFHCLKGKRSICDHMQEAVNYINSMQKNIQELRIHRDRMKELSDSSGIIIPSSNSSDNLPNCVKVNPTRDGLEILISSSIKNSEFFGGLQQVLAELGQREELNVVSSVSTKTKGGFSTKSRPR